jgi:hypothetical protein
MANPHNLISDGVTGPRVIATPRLAEMSGVPALVTVGLFARDGRFGLSWLHSGATMADVLAHPEKQYVRYGDSWIEEVL